MIRTTASAISSRAADWPIARPSEKLCRPIPVAMKTESCCAGESPPRPPPRSNSAVEAAPGPSIRRARWRFIHASYQTRLSRPAEKPTVSSSGEPGEPSAVAVLERRLDRLDRRGEDVPEQEEQDPGRGRGEERLHRRRHAPHPGHRQAEEDRQAGDRAEEEDLGCAHLLRAFLPAVVRVTLHTKRSTIVAAFRSCAGRRVRSWHRGIRSTSTSRRSTSSRSRSASTARRPAATPRSRRGSRRCSASPARRRARCCGGSRTRA